MTSTKFLKLAKTIAKRDKQAFDNLLEFEDTKKIRTKTRMDFTVDKAVAANFKKYCRDNGYNMSAKVEQLIKKFVEKGC